MFSLLGCEGVVVSYDSDGDVKIKFDDGGSFTWNPELLEGGGSGEGASAATKFVVGQRVRIRDVSRSTADSLQKGHGGINNSMYSLLGCKGVVVSCDSDGDVSVQFDDGHSYLWNPKLVESGGSGEGASAASKFAVGQRVRVRDVSCDTAKSEQVGRGGWVYSMSTNLGCEGRVLHLISEFKVRVKVGDDSFIWSPTLLEPMETRGDPVTIRETSDHRGGQRGAIIKVDPDDSLPYLVQFDDGSTYWYKKSEVLLTDSSVAASPPQEAGQEVGFSGDRTPLTICSPAHRMRTSPSAHADHLRQTRPRPQEDSSFLPSPGYRPAEAHSQQYNIVHKDPASRLKQWLWTACTHVAPHRLHQGLRTIHSN